MTLSVSTVVALGDSPAVQFTVTSSPAVTDVVRVWRTHEDGSSYRVLTGSGATIIGTFTDLDYHAPFNQPVTYRAETDTQVSAESAAQWLVSDSSTWLIHPSDPSLSVLVDKIMALGDYVFPDRSTKFQVLNRKLPVRRTDYPRGGETGAITVKCPDEASRAAVKALLAAGGPILLNTPFGADEIGWKWVQPGDFKLVNPAGKTWFAYREGSFPYEECEQPDADTAAIWEYADMTTQYVGQTYANLATAYAGKTYADLKLRVI